MGEIYLQQDGKDKAQTCFEEVLTKAPESPHTAQLLHDLLINTAPDLLEAFWKELLERHPDAEVPRNFLDQLSDPGDFSLESD